MSLRRRLSILVGIGLTPPLLLVMVNTARWQIRQEEDLRAAVIGDARLLATEVTQEIEGAQQAMTIMSKFPGAPGDEAGCTAYFKSVIASLPIYREAALIDKDGKFHCSTIPIPPTLNVSDRAYFYEPIASQKFTIGVLTKGRVTGETSIHLSMPYEAPDKSMTGVIVVILDPQKLVENLTALPFHPRDRIVVVDRQGAVVMAYPQADDVLDAIAAEIFKKVRWDQTQTVDTDVVPNKLFVVGTAGVNVGSGNLGVMVAVDRNAAMSGAWAFAARNLAAALVAILLAIGGAWIATHWLITRPVNSLVDVARRRERGDSSAQFPDLNRQTEFGQLSLSLAHMSAKVDELLAQKALFLRELQHRVMNSLNLLSSIFDIQRRKRETTEVTREQLASARNRVVALGTVYRHLYNNDVVDNIEVGELLKFVARESANAYEGSIKLNIETEIEPLLLSGTNAISLAMLTHELIMNSIKHAYGEGDAGTVKVTLKRTEIGFAYRFSDSGRGLPEDFQIEKSDSLGMIMINATTRQLGGKLTINKLDPGTEFVLELPASIEETDA